MFGLFKRLPVNFLRKRFEQIFKQTKKILKYKHITRETHGIASSSSEQLSLASEVDRSFMNSSSYSIGSRLICD